VLCFDSDEAGQNAMVRSLDSLLASGLAVRVATVPSPHDPDSFIKASGSEAFRALITGAEGFFDYYLRRLCAANDVTTDKGRLAVLRGMAEAVKKPGNVVLVDTYAQKTALRLGVSPEAVRAEFKKGRGPNPQVEPEAEESEEAPLPSISAHELVLLKLMLETDEHVDWVARHINSQWLESPLAREILTERVKAHQAGAWQGIAQFLTQLTQAKSLVSELVMQPLVADVDGTRFQRSTTLPNPVQQLADVALRLRNQYIDRQLGLSVQRAGSAELGDDERLQLLRQQQDLRLQKRQPIAPLPSP
jgi:DNA primase